MIQDNAIFTFLHRIADVDRRKSRHLSKVLLGDVSLVAELLKPQRKDVCVELHVKTLQNSSLSIFPAFASLIMLLNPSRFLVLVPVMPSSAYMPTNFHSGLLQIYFL